MSVYHRHLRFLHPSDTPNEKTPNPFLLRHASFVRADGTPIDDVLAVFMPQGRSYTGLDQIEIFCHGGTAVARLILQELLKSGIRSAEPGEFTKLAFLSGRIDLSQAEAVAEVIAASTESSLKAAQEHLSGAYSQTIDTLHNELVAVIAEVEASIDFPEEDFTPAERSALDAKLESLLNRIEQLLATYKSGRIIRDGFTVALAGRPNAGKSSLFNLLLKKERAIVAPKPGTTRDYLSEWIELDGYAVNLVDTAGLRVGGGEIEKTGQRSTKNIISRADLVLWLFDGSKANWKSNLTKDISGLKNANYLLLFNKVDLVKQHKTAITSFGASDKMVAISSLKGAGIAELRKRIIESISAHLSDSSSGQMVTSERHRQKLSTAFKEIKNGRTKLTSSAAELVAFHLRQAAVALEEITGKVYTEEILGKIFASFCIGK